MYVKSLAQVLYVGEAPPKEFLLPLLVDRIVERLKGGS